MEGVHRPHYTRLDMTLTDIFNRVLEISILEMHWQVTGLPVFVKQMIDSFIRLHLPIIIKI